MSSTLTNEKPIEHKERSPSEPLETKAARQVRRTRDANPAKRRGTPTMKSNGHEASTAEVNGHGCASPSSTAQETAAPSEQGKAASDDARDFPSAAAASSAVAGTERDACAEVAEPKEGKETSRPKAGRRQAGKEASRVPSESNRKPKNGRKKGTSDAEEDTVDTIEIPPGSETLPEDGIEFVDIIHEHVDIALACARLVKAKDMKISQRMVERLLEMSYGKGPAAAEEVPQIIFDVPRPIRD
jgi:hypothetical protein